MNMEAGVNVKSMAGYSIKKERLKTQNLLSYIDLFVLKIEDTKDSYTAYVAFCRQQQK